MRIVIFTGYPSTDAAFRAGRELGIVGYVQKGAPVAHLLAALEGQPPPRWRKATLRSRKFSVSTLGACSVSVAEIQPAQQKLFTLHATRYAGCLRAKFRAPIGLKPAKTQHSSQPSVAVHHVPALRDEDRDNEPS